jgi:hypothetical protein
MVRGIASVVAGLCAWTIVATAANLLLRFAWPGYAAVEPAMSFTLGMLGVRLAIGALASVAAGFSAAWIAKGTGAPVRVLAALLLLMFIPVHYRLWDKFPIWYHLTFLASLIPFTLLGAFWKAKTAQAASQR